MISNLQNTLCVDSSRIYATGKSNGRLHSSLFFRSRSESLPSKTFSSKITCSKSARTKLAGVTCSMSKVRFNREVLKDHMPSPRKRGRRDWRKNDILCSYTLPSTRGFRRKERGQAPRAFVYRQSSNPCSIRKTIRFGSTRRCKLRQNPKSF